MLCFEVEINREQICTTGIGEFGYLTSALSWRRSRKPNPSPVLEERSAVLSVGGVIETEPDTDEVLEWVERDLAVGDEVTIRIVEAARSDEPAERRPRVRKACLGPGCSFCGKRFSEVRKMIGSVQGAHICNECVDRLSQVLAKEQPLCPDGGAA